MSRKPEFIFILFSYLLGMGCANYPGGNTDVLDDPLTQSQTSNLSNGNSSSFCGTWMANITPAWDYNLDGKDHYIACFSGTGTNSIHISGVSAYSNTLQVYPVKIEDSQSGLDEWQLIKDPKDSTKVVSVPVILSAQTATQGVTFSIPIPTGASFDALIVVANNFKYAFEQFFIKGLGLEPPYSKGLLNLH